MSAEKVFQILLAAGADVNALPSRQGQSAIHRALYNGLTGVIENLLDAGADICSVPTNEWGTILLRHVAARRDARILQALWVKGDEDMQYTDEPNMEDEALPFCGKHCIEQRPGNDRSSCHLSV